MHRSPREKDVFPEGPTGADAPPSILRLCDLLPDATPAAAAGGSDDSYAERLRLAARRFQTVDGLVFDMGDVLFDATAWRRRLLQLLRRVGLQAGYRSLFQVWDRDFLDAVHCGRRDYAEAFVAFLREAGLSAGQVDEIVAASNQFKRQIESEVRLFPGVASSIERLHVAGLKLAVLTDSESPGAVVHQRLRSLGVGRYFDVVVSSVELGVTKPQRHGYLTTLQRLGLEPARAAFVGHDAEELRGARRCGLATIAFNYDPNASADCRIAHFSDLVGLLAARGDGRAAHGRAA